MKKTAPSLTIGTKVKLRFMARSGVVLAVFTGPDGKPRIVVETPSLIIMEPNDVEIVEK